MTEKKHFGYTESENISTELIKTDTYTYDSTWKDLLTGYHGGTIQYDGIGNPTAYLGKSLAWSQGRRLKSVDGTVSYGYDESGLRTSKTENGVKTEYFWLGKRLMSEWRSSGPAREFVYWYDENGEIVGFRYNGELYYYVKNLQGDVIGILDSLYQVVARYTYDTWGKLMGITDENGNSITAETHVAYLNPIRYRGYYYDNETGWYYLQSRYYDPEVGRFLNADSLLDTEELMGLNVFIYCGNNPIIYYDPTGRFAISAIIIGTLLGAAIGFGGTVLADYADDGEIFNGSISTSGYIVNTVVGGLIGGFTGGIGSSTFTFTYPTLSLTTTSLGTALVVSTATATISGAEVLAGAGWLGGIIMFSRIGKSGGYRIIIIQMIMTQHMFIFVAMMAPPEWILMATLFKVIVL